MTGALSSSPSLSDTTGGTIELKRTRDEIGESDNEKEKVEYTKKQKLDLYEELTAGKSEIARLSAALGVTTSLSQAKGTLKEQLTSVKLALDDLRLKKQQRVQDFSETELQIIRISAEIAGNDQVINNAEPQMNEDDLTTSRLSELKSHLEELQKEKDLRLQKVDNHIASIRELSMVMSLEFEPIVAEIHSSLVDTGHVQSKSISDETLSKLAGVVNSLKQEKQERLTKIQDLGSALIELWNLLETPFTDRLKFEDVTGYNKSSVTEVSWPGSLSGEVIAQAENEVARLNLLKGSKMKDIPQSPGQIAQLNTLKEGSKVKEYPGKVTVYSNDVNDVIVQVTPMGPKLVDVFIRDKEGGQRKMAEVDINLSSGYYTFARDIQIHCRELDELEEIEELPIPHICSPCFPVHGEAEYYGRTKQGDKLINPLEEDWESFLVAVDFVVISSLDSDVISPEVAAIIELVDPSDAVTKALPIFKRLIKDSAHLLPTAIYFYYCSKVETEPKFEDKEPDLIWGDAEVSYFDDKNQRMEVEMCDYGVMDMPADDFLRKLTRILIVERLP